MNLYIKIAFGFIVHMVSSLIMIWSLNTLFNMGIPFSFKTWLAGMLLIYITRYHFNPRSASRPVCPCDYEDDDDDEFEEEDEELEEDVEPKNKKKRSEIVVEKIGQHKSEQQPEPKGRRRGRQ